MMAGCDWGAGLRVALGWLAAGAGERQGMCWGGGLILSKAQKSATAPAHPLLAIAGSELAKKSECSCYRLPEWLDGFNATPAG